MLNYCQMRQKMTDTFTNYDDSTKYTAVNTDEFRKTIRTLNYTKTKFTTPEREALISFFSETGNEQYRIEVLHPWRVSRGKKMLNSSDGFPTYNESTQWYTYWSVPGNKQPGDLSLWHKRTVSLKDKKIKSVRLSDNCDLTVEWEKGGVFHSFNYNRDHPSFYFYDIVRSKRCLVFFEKILEEDYDFAS